MGGRSAPIVLAAAAPIATVTASTASAAAASLISLPFATTTPRLRVADEGAPDPSALHLKAPEGISAALLGHEDLAAKAPDVDRELVPPEGAQPAEYNAIGGD